MRRPDSDTDFALDDVPETAQKSRAADSSQPDEDEPDPGQPDSSQADSVNAYADTILPGSGHLAGLDDPGRFPTGREDDEPGRQGDGQQGGDEPDQGVGPEPTAAHQPGRVARLLRKAWWLHSVGALSVGVGVMILARKGLSYADEILIVLAVSWLLMFVALRLIVGPSNRPPDEQAPRKGVHVLTNYVVKNLYQQMFFFLVPMYASSATWSLSAPNWWLVPLLLVFAILSTMDLVFDNFVMERRILNLVVYGVALFGVLNLMLPVVLGIGHFPALLIAAGATAPAVALLAFPVRSVARPRGLLITGAVSAILVVGVWPGRVLVPAVPMVMLEGAVGHGTLSSYECLPANKRVMRGDRLDGLRCGSLITEPGGLRDSLFHVWKRRGDTVHRTSPKLLTECYGQVYRSYLHIEDVAGDPIGAWSCEVETSGGQLVGLVNFEIVPGPGPAGDGRTDGGTGKTTGGSGQNSPDARR